MNLIDKKTLDFLIDTLEEGDKFMSTKAMRDPIMMAQTDFFFELGLENWDTIKGGFRLYKSVMKNFQTDMLTVTDGFIRGRITYTQAMKQFKGFCGKHYEDLFVAGTLGTGNPHYKRVGIDSHSRLLLNKARRREMQFFKGLLDDIQDPKHLPAKQIPKRPDGTRMRGYRAQRYSYLKRSRFYADSGKGQMFNGMVAGVGNKVKIKWVLGIPMLEHCDICPIFAKKIFTWKTLPTIPRAGDTPCLYRCYCRLEFIPRVTKTSMQFRDWMGRGTVEGLLGKGRYAQPTFGDGTKVSGVMLADIEAYTAQMNKARQMMDITKGKVRRRWMMMRKELNRKLIELQRLNPGLKIKPTMAVSELRGTVQTANKVGLENFIAGVNQLSIGDEVVFVRSDYSAKGTIVSKYNKLYFRAADGIEMLIDDYTDIIFKLKDLKMGNPAYHAAEADMLNEFGVTTAQREAYLEILGADSLVWDDIHVRLKKFGITKTKAQVFSEITEVRQKLAAAFKNNELSHLKHIDPTTGKVSAARLRTYKKIMDEILSKVKSAAKPGKVEPLEFLMTGGKPGSGKSGMLKKILEDWQKKYVHIDADDIMKRLMRMDGLDPIKNGWRAALYHNEANIVVEKLRLAAVQQYKHVLYDQTMRDYARAHKWAVYMKKKGYTVGTYFADVPTKEAITRTITRFFETGRWVDPAYTITHGARNIDAFNLLKRWVDKWARFDLNVPRGANPILLESFEALVELRKLLEIKGYDKLPANELEKVLARHESMLERLPLKFQQEIRKVTICSASEFEKAYVRLGGTPGLSPVVAGFYSRQDYKIYLNGIGKDTFTILHEVAHRVWQSHLMPYAAQGKFESWLKLAKRDRIKYRRAYSLKNANEFFADCLASYYNGEIEYLAHDIIEWFDKMDVTWRKTV